MKSIKLILILSVIFSSCSGNEPDCDCNVLFPDKEGIFSQAVSPNEEMNEMLVKKYRLEWKIRSLDEDFNKLKRETNQPSAEEIKQFYDRMVYLEKNMHMHVEQLANLRMKMERLEYAEKPEFIQPFTGTCLTKIINRDALFITADFENGKLIGKWKYLDKDKKVIEEFEDYPK